MAETVHSIITLSCLKSMAVDELRGRGFLGPAERGKRERGGETEREGGGGETERERGERGERERVTPAMVGAGGSHLSLSHQRCCWRPHCCLVRGQLCSDTGRCLMAGSQIPSEH